MNLAAAPKTPIPQSQVQAQPPVPRTPLDRLQQQYISNAARIALLEFQLTLREEEVAVLRAQLAEKETKQ